jgi:precorrin-6B methylase 2
MKLRIIYTSVLFAISSYLTAYSHFEYLPVNQTINEPEFLKLKQKVLNHLTDSWCSQEKVNLLLDLVVTTKPQICVEIGSFTGSTTIPILTGLKYLKKGRGYAIEPWSNQEATRGLPPKEHNKKWWQSANMHEIKNQFRINMAYFELNQYLEVIQKSSKDAISLLPSIDLLVIDGNFSEEGALLDSELYLPKVVQGGHILICNTLIMVDGKPTKMKALWPLFEYCDLVYEIENGNSLLFRKN